ncbi:MAG TPA: hypothetical protein VGC62_16850 [Pseudomonas sp.]|uniref:hypothetical protein n=1 Tax=Pseudomonas sp. TaxID=306 RepID=UPI002ED8A080
MADSAGDPRQQKAGLALIATLAHMPGMPWSSGRGFGRMAGSSPRSSACLFQLVISVSASRPGGSDKTILVARFLTSFLLAVWFIP